MSKQLIGKANQRNKYQERWIIYFHQNANYFQILIAFMYKLMKSKLNNNLFYCESCVNKDFNFRPSNYIRIREVLDSEDDSMIYNWPPLSDITIQQKLNEIIEKLQQEQTELENQVIRYFNQMKEEIVQAISGQQKKMMKLVSDIPTFLSTMENKYSSISRLNDLKKIIKGDYKDSQEREKQYLCLIGNLKEEMPQNTHTFSQLLQENAKISSKINFESPNKIKQYLIDNIKQLDVFSYVSTNQSNESQQIISNVYRNQMVDILTNLEFIKSTFNQQDSDLQFERNLSEGSLTIRSEQNFSYGQYYSNLLFQKNKTYRFRFKVSPNNSQQQCRFYFGLIIDEIKDSVHLTYNNLCLGFDIINNVISLSQIQSISKYLIGPNKQISTDKEFELLFNLDQELLELQTYPDITNKISLNDQFKSNLTSFQNFRVGISLQGKNQVTFFSALEQ